MDPDANVKKVTWGLVALALFGLLANLIFVSKPKAAGSEKQTPATAETQPSNLKP